MSVTFSANGLDQVEELISEQFVAVRLESGQRHPVLTIEQTAVDPLTVGRMNYDMTVDMDAEPLNAIGIVHPRSGRATYRSRGEERTCLTGDLRLFAHPDDGFTASFDQLDCDFAMFDPTLLGEVALPVPGDPGPVRLTDYAPISTEATGRWMATFQFVRQAVAQPDLPPLVSGSMLRVLAAATLVTFPSNALLDPTIEDRHDAHPDTVRRAVAYIDSHLERDFTVIDVAAASYVTPRAVQLAFRRHLDTTPMAYARRARLDQARRDLVAATPNGSGTVTSIAGRWGFSNHSRFAQQYRQAFGELPGDTLRR